MLASVEPSHNIERKLTRLIFDAISSSNNQKEMFWIMF